jgi:acetylornithine deacetylase/succinyl-diaminopimelate desuccinylase-like protein
MAEAVAAACPKGVTAEWRPFHSAAPSVSDPDNRLRTHLRRAMTEIFGNQTVYIRSGGSIPIAGLFHQHLGIPSVLAGFGLPDDNLHAPNEKLYLPNFYRGIDAIVRYLEKLA